MDGTYVIKFHLNRAREWRLAGRDGGEEGKRKVVICRWRRRTYPVPGRSGGTTSRVFGKSEGYGRSRSRDERVLCIRIERRDVCASVTARVRSVAINVLRGGGKNGRNDNVRRHDDATRAGLIDGAAFAAVTPPHLLEGTAKQTVMRRVVVVVCDFVPIDCNRPISVTRRFPFGPPRRRHDA